MNISYITIFFLIGQTTLIDAYAINSEEDETTFSVRKYIKSPCNLNSEYLDKMLKSQNYKDFASYLGIDAINLVKPKKDDYEEDPVFSKDLFLGDILATKENQEKARYGVISDEFQDLKWPENVPYVISSEFKKEHHLFIQSSISKWNNDIKSIKWVQCTTEVDFVYIFPGSSCFSEVGKIGGLQVISLNEDLCFQLPGRIFHEMNHVLGFSHEHMRSDRDKYVSIIWDNIPEIWREQYQIKDNRDIGNVLTYDYGSIMHYPLKAPETMRPAFKILKDGIDIGIIGQRERLSELDLKKIEQLYS